MQKNDWGSRTNKRTTAMGHRLPKYKPSISIGQPFLTAMAGESTGETLCWDSNPDNNEGVYQWRS